MSNRPPRTVAEVQYWIGQHKLQARAMVSRYSGECGWCGQALMPGDAIAWLPSDKAALCGGCVMDGAAP